jgi:methionyl-tRNA formyltransferase
MRIVFFTSVDSLSSGLFSYMYAHVAHHFPDVRIVATAGSESLSGIMRRYARKMRRLGFWPSLEIITSMPIHRVLSRRDMREKERLLHSLPRPALQPLLAEAILVPAANGPEAVRALEHLSPEVIIQAGAGILRRRIFALARIGTLNLHHGIAPLIKGMDSIYWALWEKKPQWVGLTIHWIDEGIDTGGILAYAPVTPEESDTFPSLFAKASAGGVAELIAVLQRLARGEKWEIAPAVGVPAYRSTFSGWRLLLMQLRRSKARLAGKGGATGVPEK